MPLSQCHSCSRFVFKVACTECQEETKKRIEKAQLLSLQRQLLDMIHKNPELKAVDVLEILKAALA